MRREYGWPLTELGTVRRRRGDLAGAAGDVPAARPAAIELTGVAELFHSRALDASASLARGRVALVTELSRAFG